MKVLLGENDAGMKNADADLLVLGHAANACPALAFYHVCLEET